MNWTRAGILAFIALCVFIAWPKGYNPAPPRPLLIKAALKNADDPVVILGDSIVAQAPLPRTVCGRSLVNAGIGGSTTVSGLEAMLIKALGSMRPAMIAVSLGINDAASGLSIDEFGKNYFNLLATLKAATSRIAILSITSVETTLAQAQLISSYNAMLPVIAEQAGAELFTIPLKSSEHTVDGVHLNSNGYAVWTKALIDSIERRLCKPV